MIKIYIDFAIRSCDCQYMYSLIVVSVYRQTKVCSFIGGLCDMPVDIM